MPSDIMFVKSEFLHPNLSSYCFANVIVPFSLRIANAVKVSWNHRLTTKELVNMLDCISWPTQATVTNAVLDHTTCTRHKGHDRQMMRSDLFEAEAL